MVLPSIGFVILSHSRPKHLLRLTTTLCDLYDPKAIACHHDFRYTNVEPELFPTPVSFVQPHKATRWGHISIVWAVVAGLRRLYEISDPDWFTILSESDYPARPATVVLQELRDSQYDTFLDYHLVKYTTDGDKVSQEVASGNRVCNRAASPEWNALAYERYFSVRAPIPFLFSRRRALMTVRHPLLVWPFHCFGPSRRCFAGELWFTGNRRTAETILREADPASPLIKHFSSCRIPDEAVFHTILCNKPDLKICAWNRRYSDWSDGGIHPKELQLDDIHKIRASGADFVRKLGQDTSVADALDEAIGYHAGAPTRPGSSLRSVGIA